MGPDLSDLGAELEELAASDAEAEPIGPVLPPGFSLFTAKPEAVEKLSAAGRDPRVAYVRVIPIHHGKKGHMVAKYSPEGLTLERLRRALPPGSYDLQGMNADGLWVGGKRIHLSDATGLDKLPGQGNGNGNGNGNGGGGTMAERVLYALAMKGLQGNENRSSEIEKATAATLSTVRSMIELQMADAKMRAMTVEAQDRKQERGDTRSLDMFKLLIPVLTKQNASRAPSEGGAGKFEDFVGAMQLGVQMAQAMNGNAPTDPDKSTLEKWLLPIATELGPGLVSVFAMMLPPEQRQMASDLLESHFKAREAEAVAAAESSEDPPTVETEGHTVGGGD
jgi:hypothetical protein